jgi:hypothetical protein
LSKGQKNDFRDAEAIAEAVQRPTMRFVGTKSADQLDLQALHRVRERLGATHFQMRRLPKVASEMALHVLAYNMKRVIADSGRWRIDGRHPGLRCWRAQISSSTSSQDVIKARGARFAKLRSTPPSRTRSSRQSSAFLHSLAG